MATDKQLALAKKIGIDVAGLSVKEASEKLSAKLDKEKKSEGSNTQSVGKAQSQGSKSKYKLTDGNVRGLALEATGLFYGANGTLVPGSPEDMIKIAKKFENYIRNG